MCHFAPVFKIHSTASRTLRAGIGLRPGRRPENFPPENVPYPFPLLIVQIQHASNFTALHAPAR